MNSNTEVLDKSLKDSLLKNKEDLLDVKLVLPNENTKNEFSSDDQEELVQFVGLKKEELMKYAKDPYWMKLRIILLIIFAVVWFVMLAAAITIIVLAPKCPPEPNLQWWQKGAVIYYLHPKSFVDTNGDGQGDINGIVSKLDYLKNALGVAAINVGPLQHSPHLNFGYDVSDHKTVCHRYGNMDSFEHLLHESHKIDMKLIVDFIPNHTSKKHKWFMLSRNRTEGFEDYYIWRAGPSTSQPPNNWMSIYGGSAWEYDEERKEFYYHAYSVNEPDLNLRNEAVLKNIDEALLFWLQKKIDGVRIVGAKYLMEDIDFTDEDASSNNSLQHERTTFQLESYQLLNHWRKMMDDFSHNTSLPRSYQFERLLMADASGKIKDVAQFSLHNGSQGAHLTSNQLLMEMGRDCDSKCLCALVKEYWGAVGGSSPIEFPLKQVYNWQTGGFTSSRMASRLDANRLLNVLHLLHLMLPGASLLYYGDEFGMTDNKMDAIPVNSSLTMESLGRAGSLTPMQWTDGHASGFTSGTPWMPINSDYIVVNVMHELAQGSTKSYIKTFKEATKLIAAERSLQWGDLHSSHHQNIFYFIRQATGYASVLVAVNFGSTASTINFKEGDIGHNINAQEAVVVLSAKASEDLATTFLVGAKVSLNSVVYLRPGDAIVLRWEDEKKLFF